MEDIPDQVYQSGDAVSIQVVATDVDDTLLTYSTTGLPPGITIDPVTGLISGQLAADEQGDFEVTAAVSDPLGASDERTFTVLVNRAVDEVMLYLPIISSSHSVEEAMIIYFPIILTAERIIYMPVVSR